MDGTAQSAALPQDAMTQLLSQVAVLEERSKNQESRLSELTQAINNLRDKLNHHLPYTVTIAFSIMSLIIGALATLLAVRW